MSYCYLKNQTFNRISGTHLTISLFVVLFHILESYHRVFYGAAALHSEYPNSHDNYICCMDESFFFRLFWLVSLLLLFRGWARRFQTRWTEMSEKSSQSTKAKDGKTKYATLSLFNTYKGKALETQKTTGMFVKAEHFLPIN